MLAKKTLIFQTKKFLIFVQKTKQNLLHLPTKRFSQTKISYTWAKKD